MAETDEQLPEPASPVEQPKRAGTILGRLAQAVREQNWFAVALELVIVVLGVVIGFQVTAWGQARADRVKERGHLWQLAADLRETERLMGATDDARAESDRAAGLIWDAFYAPEQPPTDSLRLWRATSSNTGTTFPVLGTAETLVATGDIGLVRDDSLRTAILAYLQGARREMDYQTLTRDRWADGAERLDRGIKVTEALLRTYTPVEIEAMLGTGSNYPLRHQDSIRWRFAFDLDDFLNDEEMEDAAEDLTGANWSLRLSRARMRGAAADLRGRVETYLGRDLSE